MDRTRMYYAKQNKSIRERQILFDFTHIWNLRNKTGEHNVRRVKKEKIGKQTTRDSSFLQESSGRGGQKDGGRETNRERI